MEFVTSYVGLVGSILAVDALTIKIVHQINTSNELFRSIPPLPRIID